MKVLVTGSSGFVGSKLCPLLEKSNIEVVRYNRSGPMSQMEGCDCIIHLAGLAHITHKVDPNQYEKANFELTRVLVDAAIKYKIKKFIFMSTLKVMGEDSSGGWSETDKPSPESPYAKAKFKAEQYLISKQESLNYIILRPPLIYGAGVKANFKMLIKLVKMGLPLPFRNLANKRSYLYVENLNHLIADSLSLNKYDNNIFMPIDSDALSTGELLDKLSMLYRKKRITFFFPQRVFKLLFVLIGKKELYQKIAGNFWTNQSKLAGLGWKPPYTLEEGLQKTIND